jgi:hypothetical protein
MSEAQNPKKTPPKHVQPKRQRPGSRRRRRFGLDIPSMIDDFLISHIALTEGETSQRVSCFEAIFRQLWRKEMAGSRKAGKLLVRLMNFAASQGSHGGIELRIKPNPPADEVNRGAADE